MTGDNAKELRPRVDAIVWGWGYGPGHSLEDLERIVVLQDDVLDELRRYIHKLRHRAERAEGILRGAIANDIHGPPQ